MFKHPNFEANTNTYKNDIALLKLDREVNLFSYTAMIISISFKQKFLY